MRADKDAPSARKVKRIYTIDDIEWLDKFPENANRQWELVEGKVVTRHFLGFWPGAWLSTVLIRIVQACRGDGYGHRSASLWLVHA